MTVLSIFILFLLFYRFYKLKFQIASSQLAGSAKPKDDKLSELERVLIGMGVTFAVLIIIILCIVVCF